MGSRPKAASRGCGRVLALRRAGLTVFLITGLLGVPTSERAEAWNPLPCRQPSSTVAIINNAPAQYQQSAVNAAAAWRFPGSRVNVQMVPPGTWTINAFSAFAWGPTIPPGITTFSCSAGFFVNPVNSWANRTHLRTAIQWRPDKHSWRMSSGICLGWITTRETAKVRASRLLRCPSSAHGLF